VTNPLCGQIIMQKSYITATSWSEDNLEFRRNMCLTKNFANESGHDREFKKIHSLSTWSMYRASWLHVIHVLRATCHGTFVMSHPGRSYPFWGLILPVLKTGPLAWPLSLRKRKLRIPFLESTVFVQNRRSDTL